MNSKEKGWLLQAYRQVLGSCMLTGGAVISDFKCGYVDTLCYCDAKGGEMETKGEHELLSSMKKGEIVD